MAYLRVGSSPEKSWEANAYLSIVEHGIYLHTKVAFPVRCLPSADVAATVTGFITAAVHVTEICAVGMAERRTDGSLTIQLELIRAEVLAVQTPLP